MESIFEVPWRELDVEHVRRFLASASGEGLTWEGKATASLRGLRSKIVAGVCGLANQLGGFFILGAEERSGGWALAGVEDDAGEDAHDWLARVLNDHLREPPPFDVRRWRVEDGRLVAVIRVDEAAVPPCMTKDGLVYQRLVGETKKVTDPRILRELIQRGQAARDGAEERAVAAVNRLVDIAPLAGTVEWRRIAVALAPTTAREDYSARLFTPTFTQALDQAAESLEVLPASPSPLGVMHRDGYVVRQRSAHSPQSWEWAIQALWNGTVAVELAAPRDGRLPPPTADEIIGLGWRAAAGALPLLTGIRDREHVPTHFAARTNDVFRLYLPRGGPADVSTGQRPIQRWTTMAEPSDAELESVKRELARSAGAEVYEPEPESASEVGDRQT